MTRVSSIFSQMLQLFSRVEFEQAVREYRTELRAPFGWSLSNLAALLHQQLFVYRHLFTWLDEPFQPPQQLDLAAEQMALSWRV